MRDTLNSHPVSTLKKEIAKSNIKGYSKMKKSEIVDLMMENKDKFIHIMLNKKKEKKPTKRDESTIDFLNALSKETRKERLKLKKNKRRQKSRPCSWYYRTGGGTSYRHEK